MESIEKLRSWASYMLEDDNDKYRDVNKLTYEIEREVAERYMELPVDADDVPIHVGDEVNIVNGSGNALKVKAVSRDEFLVIAGFFNDKNLFHASSCVHVKQRTVEDLLDDLMSDDEWGSDKDYQTIKSDLIEKYATEIRDLLGVGE